MNRSGNSAFTLRSSGHHPVWRDDQSCQHPCKLFPVRIKWSSKQNHASQPSTWNVPNLVAYSSFSHTIVLRRILKRLWVGGWRTSQTLTFYKIPDLFTVDAFFGCFPSKRVKNCCHIEWHFYWVISVYLKRKARRTLTILAMGSTNL